MEGHGEFKFACESSEVNGNQRAIEEVPATTRSGAHETLEVTSSYDQGILHGTSSSSQRGQKSRHSKHQIQELEKCFQSNHHPDESERLEIGRKLNLEANQVKFWFQNKRTHIKNQTDRHANMILKQENENLRLEILAIKEAMQNMLCKNCGGPTIQVDNSGHDRNLMSENARLKEELNRVTSLIHQLSGRTLSTSSSQLPDGMANPNDINATERLAVLEGARGSYGGPNPVKTEVQMGTAENNQVSYDQPLIASTSRSAMGVAASGSNVPKTANYLELASSAMEELMKLGLANAPLWHRSLETGGETLNLKEYARSFPPLLGTKQFGFVSEASRATGMVSLTSLELVEALMDADPWRDMFAGMIGSSATNEVISEGIEGSRNGVLQLMQAEIQLISPSVAARVVKFLRFCKQQGEGVWAVVDLSVDARKDGITCRRLPSGCILYDLQNGFSKVIWVEHTEYDERPVHHQYRQLLSSGLGFGAQKWIHALLRHCEWLKALPSHTPNNEFDQTTRTSFKALARRMTSIFCAGVCLTGGQRWNLVSNAPRIMSRRGMNGPADPPGTILSLTTSVWIPTTHRRLFDLLLSKDLRCMWDVLFHQKATGRLAHFPMSHDDSDPNSISLLGSNTTEQDSVMVLQETSSDMTGSLIVFAPVDWSTVTALINNQDISSVALLPSGLCLVPGSGELGGLSGELGSMVTVGFQILLQDSVSPNPITDDAISTCETLVSRTVLGIQEIGMQMQSRINEP